VAKRRTKKKREGSRRKLFFGNIDNLGVKKRRGKKCPRIMHRVGFGKKKTKKKKKENIGGKEGRPPTPLKKACAWHLTDPLLKKIKSIFLLGKKKGIWYFKGGELP